MLGTSLRDMSTPTHGSKRSGSIKKATTLGAPHAKKKRRLNGLDEKRGRGRGGDTQSQMPTVARRSQRQQEQPTRGRGGQKAQRAMTAAFEEVIGGNKGGARGAKSITQSLDNKRSCSMMLWTCLTMGTGPPSLPLLPACAKPLHLWSIMLRMMSLMAAMQLRVLCPEFKGDSGGGAMQSAIVVGGGGRHT